MPDTHYALPAGHALKGGDYIIDRELGTGGFGITYLATETSLNQLVAIKEYLPSDFAVRVAGATVQPKSANSRDDYAWGLKSFVQEAQALARFNHPNINQVERFFEENGTAYMVLEYIAGDTLSAILQRDGTLPAAQLTRLITDLLAGLAPVHAAGFVHRDIKPSNIIFRADGSAVLIDFGAARQAIGTATRSLTVVLTPGYAPAEQYARRSAKVGAWSDLYALGMVAYRCVSGINDRDLPDSAERQLAGDASDPLRPASEVARGDYPPALLTAIDAATRTAPQDRLQSIAAMRGLIGEDAPALTQSPAQAKPASRTAIGLLATRKRAFTYAAGGLMVIVVGWLGVWAWPMSEDANLCAEKRAEVTRTSGEHGYTELHLAAQNNNLARAKQLIGWCADVQAKSINGATPLHRAAQYNSIEVAKWLLDNGAMVQAKSNHGATPLHHAALGVDKLKDSLEIAKWLLDNGAMVQAKDNYGATPLHWTVTFNSIEVAKLLLADGAEVNTKNNNGFTPLHKAVSHWAIMLKSHEVARLELAKILLVHGANVQAKDNVGDTPLHTATRYWDSLEVAKLLLANGADVHAKNNQGNTLLHQTATEENIKVAKLLLANGANVHAKNNLGRTPLHLAAIKHSKTVPELLIAKGADVDAKTDTGLTPLHFTAMENNFYVATLLLTNGANVDAKTMAAKATPLTVAVQENSIAVAKLLLTNGADVGYRELNFSRSRGYTNMLRLLQQYQ